MFNTFPSSATSAVSSVAVGVSAFEVSVVVLESLFPPHPTNIVATMVAHSSALTTFFFIYSPPYNLYMDFCPVTFLERKLLFVHLDHSYGLTRD